MKKTRIERAHNEIQKEIDKRQKDLDMLNPMTQDFTECFKEYNELCKIESSLWEFRVKEIKEDLAKDGICL